LNTISWAAPFPPPGPPVVCAVSFSSAPASVPENFRVIWVPHHVTQYGKGRLGPVDGPVGDGKWVLETRGPLGKQTRTLTVQAEGGKLTGTMDNQGAVVDGKVPPRMDSAPDARVPAQ
jgi:hypothetical protein